MPAPRLQQSRLTHPLPPHPASRGPRKHLLHLPTAFPGAVPEGGGPPRHRRALRLLLLLLRRVAELLGRAALAQAAHARVVQDLQHLREEAEN